jgi:hypothetical protein
VLSTENRRWSKIRFEGFFNTNWLLNVVQTLKMIIRCTPFILLLKIKKICRPNTFDPPLFSLDSTFREYKLLSFSRDDGDGDGDLKFSMERQPQPYIIQDIHTKLSKLLCQAFLDKSPSSLPLFVYLSCSDMVLSISSKVRETPTRTTN